VRADKVEYMSREEARKVHVRLKKIIQSEVCNSEVVPELLAL
jgi:hypothetical protein